MGPLVSSTHTFANRRRKTPETGERMVSAGISELPSIHLKVIHAFHCDFQRPIRQF
jgi:hypothetical protein